jgi:hypothetical protein
VRRLLGGGGSRLRELRDLTFRDERKAKGFRVSVAEKREREKKREKRMKSKKIV